MIEAEFYRKDTGECPVEEYLDSLNVKLRAKTLRSIMLLEEFGSELRHPYSGPLEDGIFELRSIVGTDITRVLYFFVVGNKAILTHGFTKKTQKTPKSEIIKAKKFREDYERQMREKGVKP